MSGYGVAYKTDLPVELEQELREGAAELGMSIKLAFRVFLEPPRQDCDDGDWIAHVRSLIMAGQLKSENYDLGDSKALVVRIPRKYREVLGDAAKDLWVQQRAAGRLILIGRAGHIRSDLARFVALAAAS